ncbi:type II secretion system protein GspM, partial [Craterilacuibacter sp.]|uniref:type II secretion system protein GspM n=1 Tax=Craterilacuibacter sp. TaxID=2870909 RepID=UPI003F314F63
MAQLIPGVLARYRQLSLREQRMLGVMAVAVLSTLLYFAIWEPAHRYVAKTRSQVMRLEAELAFDQKLVREAEALKRKPLVATLGAADLQNVIE